MFYYLILFLTSIIWGYGLIIQKLVNSTELYFFTGMRFILGAIILLPFIFVFKIDKTIDKEFKRHVKKDIKYGIILGIILALASISQQIGINYTTVGKAGFLSNAYVIFVPLITFLKTKENKSSILYSIIFLIGLYFLSIKGQRNDFYNYKGDFISILSSIFWAAQIILTSKYSKITRFINFAIVQFLICGLLCLILSFFLEKDNQFLIIKDNLILLLYNGIFCVGMGFLFQIVAQKHVHENHCSMILNLESLFGLILSVILLNEKINNDSLIGFIFIFISIILSQLHFNKKN